MSQFLVLFINVSVFAFYALCMNPLDLDLPSPPAPKNVKFGDCFAVHDIRSASLANDVYNYNHICPVKFPDNAPEPPRNERSWYIVGWLDHYDSLSTSADYVKIDQSLVYFTSLDGVTVEFEIGSYITEHYSVTFQSLRQSQAFYAKIYEDVILSPITPKKIGVLHEITKDAIKKIGNNLEAVREEVNGSGYITLQSKRGEPLLIFPRNQAQVTRTRPNIGNSQLLLRISTEYYIATFSNCADASEFSEALLKNEYLQPVHMSRIHAFPKSIFLNNQITIDS